MYAPQICTRRHSAAGFLVGWGALCKERYYDKKQGKFPDKPRNLPCFSLHKIHLPKDFNHSKVSVFVTQEGVAGGMTSECFSSALRCVSILALA